MDVVGGRVWQGVCRRWREIEMLSREAKMLDVGRQVAEARRGVRRECEIAREGCKAI